MAPGVDFDIWSSLVLGALDTFFRASDLPETCLIRDRRFCQFHPKIFPPVRSLCFLDVVVGILVSKDCPLYEQQSIVPTDKRERSMYLSRVGVECDLNVRP